MHLSSPQVSGGLCIPSCLCHLSHQSPGNHWCAFSPIASHLLVLYKWNHTVCILFCLASFTHHTFWDSSIFLCVSIKYIPFLCIAEEYSFFWNLFICVSVYEHFGHFHFGPLQIELLWTFVYNILCGHVFFRSRVAFSYGRLKCSVQGNKLFSKVVVPTVQETSIFSPTLSIARLWCMSHNQGTINTLPLTNHTRSDFTSLSLNFFSLFEGPIQDTRLYLFRNPVS